MKKNYLNNDDIQVIKVGDKYEKYFLESPSTNIIGLIIGHEKYINLVQKIGKGTYGYIYRFTNYERRKKDSYVIKEYLDKKDYILDKIISLILYNLSNKFNINANIVKSYWNDEYLITIMDGYENDLFNLVYGNKCYYYHPFDLFLQVTESIFSLYKYGIYYCDLKLSNIFYKVINGKIICTLGDIGSLFFSKNNYYSNILASNDLNNYTIQLKGLSNNSEYCTIGFEIDFDYHIIGYVKVTKELRKEINNTNFFRINFISSDRIELVSILNKRFNVESLNFNIFSAIFTFPHYYNYSGVIDFNYKVDDIEMEKILLNNIFHSLGIFLVEILFKSDFKLRHNQIKKNFQNSISEILLRINSSNNLSENDANLIKGILFGNQLKNGLLCKEYVEFKNPILKFSELIEKIKLILK